MRKKVQVLKRNERLEKLDISKIVDSIFLAAQDVGGTDRVLAENLAEKVVKKLGRQYGRLEEVSTAEIGDAVERVLLQKSHYKTAKAYIINREKKRKIEAVKRALGVMDDVGISYNALIVVKEKYIRRDEEGEVSESVRGIYSRVARYLAKAEKVKDRKKWEGEFLRLMVEGRFLPGGRTLANAGGKNNQLANCFVMPMPDDIEGIFEAVKGSSILKKYGGSVGFNFGHLRPRGDKVSTTSGAAAGPVALMKLIDDASDIYLQAGKRRSGNMVILPVTHPDIMDFIHCKESGENLPNINYSIALTTKFMQAVAGNKKWDLVNPRNGEIVNSVSARGLLESAARLAWKTGDPGLLFIDEINKHNPTPHVGVLEAVNLCGEQPLLSYEACNLGSINLAEHVKNENKEARVDWGKLKETVRVSVRLLDDVVSQCKYPLRKVSRTVKGNRKIGLGVMGWADMLVKLGIAYDSGQALKLAEKVMKRIRDEAWKASEDLGKEKGSFPNFPGSLWEKRGYKYFRNATVTTIAPTGTIAIVAGVSSGIEPHFALAYVRKSMGEYDLPEVNLDLVKTIKYVNGLYSDELMEEIVKKGSIADIKKIPKKIRDVFVATMDISPEVHVKMLAVFQKYTDNAVSKTINLPNGASVDSVMKIFMLAWKLRCKGITVYRDGSRDVQVLTVGSGEKTGKKKPVSSGLIKGGSVTSECPQCGGRLAMEEGCKKCYSCGFSVCG